MNDRIGSQNQLVWRLWYESNILYKFIESEDVDLLSQNYRKAIHGSKEPVATIPNVQFTGYGTQKGNWLNDELNLQYY